MARILLGVTGGIAAYKACELTRLFVRAGHEVVPLVTAGAERFVRAETFRALARQPAAEGSYPHLERADLLVVAPLSANTLAKLAHGLADNVLTEAALAHRGPVLAAPAMNPRMWSHPAVQANAAGLRERGVLFVGPEAGDTAEGEQGIGRMSEPHTILARALELLGGGSLHGKRVLVSAGGTREPIDSVRFVGNRSSGRMGVALAEEARRRGAAVTLLAANLAVPTPDGVEVVSTPSVVDLAREAAVRADFDIVVMAAAPADYAPAQARADKRPKDGDAWTLRLEPTPDVLAELGGQRRNGQVLVAFGADHGPDGLARKRGMLDSKHVDLVVFNDVGQDGIGFDAPDNAVTIMSREGDREVARAPKERIASAILDEVERLLGHD
jgi:phosphopantothenoylcysteine decarboxylase/phosphopantothenate--cysteine ligase